MARFIDEAKTAIRAAACAVLSANEFVNGAIGTVAPSVRDAFNGAINGTRALIGCTAPPISPPPPPFSGGQCTGTVYSVAGPFSFDSFRCSDGVFQSSTTGDLDDFVGVNFEGPVTAAFIEAFGSLCRGFPTGVRAVITDRGGARTRTFQISSQNSTFYRQNFSLSASFVRVSGNPDVCGSVPPVYPPPINIEIDIDVDYDDDDGAPISVTIPVIFTPIVVNLDGSLEIPFSFDFGGFTFDGSLDLSPQLNVDINLPSLPRGTGSGTEGLPPGPPADDVPSEEGERKIVGLVVTASIEANGSITSINTDSIPTIFAPRLGSVRFAYSFGGATFWSNDIDIKGARVFIPCPFDQGADFSSASPIPGVSLNVVQIRGYPVATTDDIRRSG